MKSNIILEQLAHSCINKKPKAFIPYLLEEQVSTNMPNKVRFYKFFKRMLNCAAKNSDGKLSLKVRKVNFGKEKETQLYSFYDTKHKHARLNLEVEERDNEVYIATLPF